MKTLVLLSGGIDSTCCVDFYRRAGHEVEAAFVDYGQPVSRMEEGSAMAIAAHYKVPLHIVRSSGPSKTFAGEIAGRNAFLAFAAYMYLPAFTGALALGIHSGSDYYDCSLHFLEHLGQLIVGYSSGRLSLATPFLNLSKQEVFDYCLRREVPVQFTWSCEVGPLAPCGSCLSCEDRAQLNVRAEK